MYQQIVMILHFVTNYREICHKLYETEDENRRFLEALIQRIAPFGNYNANSIGYVGLDNNGTITLPFEAGVTLCFSDDLNLPDVRIRVIRPVRILLDVINLSYSRQNKNSV
jgi:hypothetical protein